MRGEAAGGRRITPGNFLRFTCARYFFSNAAIAGHQRELNLKLFHMFGSGPDLKSMAKIWGSLLVRRGAQSCLFSFVFFQRFALRDLMHKYLRMETLYKYMEKYLLNYEGSPIHSSNIW